MEPHKEPEHKIGKKVSTNTKRGELGEKLCISLHNHALEFGKVKRQRFRGLVDRSAKSETGYFSSQDLQEKSAEGCLQSPQ